MNLTEAPEVVHWSATHYVFIEKIGPFQTTAPQAWQALHELAPALLVHNRIIGAMGLYKVDLKIYRAGFLLADAAVELPAGLEYAQLNGGKYTRFVLTGSYADLPQASRRVFEIVHEKQIQQRDDFCIEHYANDPKTTPEEQLITEILIPTL